MGTRFTAKTTVQVIPTIDLNSRIVDRALEPHYTCPVGKKATFDGIVVCTGTGAAAFGSLRDPADIFNLASWFPIAGTVNDARWDALAVGVRIQVNIQLDAGNVIKTTQSSGTNAEFNVIGKIKERNA